MTALPSLREGRRLIQALEELETATLIVGQPGQLPAEPVQLACDQVRDAGPQQSDSGPIAWPPAGRAPRMQKMVTTVHADYQRVLGGSTVKGLRSEDESFADQSDQARRLREPTSESLRTAPGTALSGGYPGRAT